MANVYTRQANKEKLATECARLLGAVDVGDNDVNREQVA